MRVKLNLILALLIALMAVQIHTAARAPVPYCFSKPIYKEFPLTFEESIDYDVEQIFSGYNLNITLDKGSEVASVGRKTSIIDRKEQHFPSIISHFIEKKGNTVGNETFILYKDDSNATHLIYGLIR